MTATDEMRAAATTLRDPHDLDALLDRIGDARYVLVGEASHGTHEYYHWRAEITKRLVEERGFSFVAVEGDWPDCARIDQSVKLAPDGPSSPREALEAFERWPTWMWANEEVLAFAEWLRDRNAERPAGERVGFYGLDVYSLWDSLRAVVGYLTEHEPEHLAPAMRALRCFEPYAEDPQEYAWASRLVPRSCEDEVVELLTELRDRASGDGAVDPALRLDVEQNAAVAAGAERYYRTMVSGGAASWNVRDRHMTDTLDRLMRHHGPRAKAVVWEHNSHIGDARATSVAASGMVTVGQLVRERHTSDGVVLVGFGGYRGSVIAADHWGGPARRMEVPEAVEGSIERRLHDAGLQAALLVFPDLQPEWLRTAAGHRAIGVVYDPARERYGNYVPTVLGERYDAFAFFDDTRALDPLPVRAREPELETWPWGR